MTTGHAPPRIDSSANDLRAAPRCVDIVRDVNVAGRQRIDRSIELQGYHTLRRLRTPPGKQATVRNGDGEREVGIFVG